MKTPPNPPAKPLSRRQKAVLCQLAGRAWNIIGAHLGYADSTEYRHACVFDVTGKSGLCDADQLDYIPLYNYFADILRMPLKQDRTPKTALDRALFILRDALERWEFAPSYAARIMRARLGPLATPAMPLEHLARLLGPEGVRQVAYTVINRGRARHSRLVNSVGGGQTTEPHASPATVPPGGLQLHFNIQLSLPEETTPARKEVAHA